MQAGVSKCRQLSDIRSGLMATRRGSRQRSICKDCGICEHKLHRSVCRDWREVSLFEQTQRSPHLPMLPPVA